MSAIITSSSMRTASIDLTGLYTSGVIAVPSQTERITCEFFNCAVLTASNKFAMYLNRAPAPTNAQYSHNLNQNGTIIHEGGTNGAIILDHSSGDISTLSGIITAERVLYSNTSASWVLKSSASCLSTDVANPVVVADGSGSRSIPIGPFGNTPTNTVVQFINSALASGLFTQGSVRFTFEW